ncbi:MAG: hypothetical protein KC944_21775 [Candidatus Omnitrophica bacterium]|nr:hypothetical protein [Candidatus Omnitrophota bacterium]
MNLIQLERPERMVRCYLNGRLVYECKRTTEPLEDIRQRAADCYCNGMVECIHAIPLPCEPLRSRLALSN